jgi:hypothetical protein
MNKRFQMSTEVGKSGPPKGEHLLKLLKSLIMEVSPELKSFEDQINVFLPNEDPKAEVFFL